MGARASRHAHHRHDERMRPLTCHEHDHEHDHHTRVPHAASTLFLPLTAPVERDAFQRFLGSLPVLGFSRQGFRPPGRIARKTPHLPAGPRPGGIAPLAAGKRRGIDHRTRSHRPASRRRPDSRTGRSPDPHSRPMIPAFFPPARQFLRRLGCVILLLRCRGPSPRHPAPTPAPRHRPCRPRLLFQHRSRSPLPIRRHGRADRGSRPATRIVTASSTTPTASSSRSNIAAPARPHARPDFRRGAHRYSNTSPASSAAGSATRKASRSRTSTASTARNSRSTRRAIPPTVTNLDESGGHVRDNNGVVQYVRTLDEHNRVIVEPAHRVVRHGHHRRQRLLRDPLAPTTTQGRTIERGNYDDHGNLLNNNDGVALVRTTYTIYPDATADHRKLFRRLRPRHRGDEAAACTSASASIDKRGFLVDEAYFDSTGAPTTIRAGIGDTACTSAATPRRPGQPRQRGIFRRQRPARRPARTAEIAQDRL